MNEKKLNEPLMNEKGRKTILFTSNHLIKSVSKYVKLNKVEEILKNEN